MEHLAFRTQKELVLLHKEGSRPKDTALWLNARTWCSSHHHLQCPKRMFSRKARMVGLSTLFIQTFAIAFIVIYCNENFYFIIYYFFIQPDYYSVVMKADPNIHSDFSRLARWLTGTSVGEIPHQWPQYRLILNVF